MEKSISPNHLLGSFVRRLSTPNSNVRVPPPAVDVICKIEIYIIQIWVMGSSQHLLKWLRAPLPMPEGHVFESPFDRSKYIYMYIYILSKILHIQK